MIKYAFVFPGQGSQFVGMGKKLYDNFTIAKNVFEEVDDALNFKLSNIIFNGDDNELKKTENTQPALYAVSMAVLKTIEEKNGILFRELNNIYFAGHSLGEYSALTAADVFDISSGAKLLRIRGQAMQQAVPPGKGGMVALLGTTIEEAEKICHDVREDAILEVANDNGAGQVVVSGELIALKRLHKALPNYSIKRGIDLPVSAPFHCSLMKPAADIMQATFKDISFNKPKAPIFSNVTASIISNEDDIKTLLVEQITGRVRWREIMENLLKNNVSEQVEVGAGKVLSTLMKRTNRNISTVHIETPEEIDLFLKTTKGI